MKAPEVPEVQQGRRSVLLMRQGPQPHRLVRPQPYHAHNGAVWSCNITRDSSLLITGSADQTAKLWSVQSGTPLFTFNFDSPTRSVDFSVGEKLLVIPIDPFVGLPSAIHVKRIADDINEQTSECVITIKGPQGRINRAVWGPLNKTIISAGEDCCSHLGC